MGGSGGEWRQAVRAVWRRPGSSAVIVSTLALSVGGVTAVFSLAHAGWLRDLPWRDGDRLVRIFTGYGADPDGRMAVSVPVLRALEARTPVVEAAGAWTVGETVHLTSAGEAVRVDAPRASAGLFRVLGVEPLLGRTFTADEEEPGRDASVVLSHGFWVRALGADPAVLGRSLELDGRSYQVVGVLPPRATPEAADLWRPLALGPEWLGDDRLGWEFLAVVARLAPGLDAARAAAELDRVLEERAADRVARLGQRVVVVPLRDHLMGPAGPALLVLLGAVGLVLLIACSNVATVLLARSEARAREFAVRRSIGAGARPLARLVLAESLVLAALGGTLGLALAQLLLAALARAEVEALAGLGPLGVSGAGVALTLVLVGGTALAVGLGAVLTAVRTDPSRVVREGAGPARGSPAAARMRGALIVGEVALALALLMGVAASLRAFGELVSADPGFRPDGMLAVEFELPAEPGPPEAQAALHRALVERAARLPGVESGGLVSVLPLTGRGWSASFALLDPEPDQLAMEPGANMRGASAGYFRTAGIPLLEGRDFGDEDALGAAPVAVVDEAVARRYWPGRSPVGRLIHLGALSADPTTVIGVVGSVRDEGLHAPGSGHVYFPLAQRPLRTATLVVRAPGAELRQAPAVREILRDLDPRMPVLRAGTAEGILRASTAGPRLGVRVLGGFGALAVLLAALGIHGVLAQTVQRRTAEIGTRLALGAEPRQVVALVVGQAFRLFLAGCVPGLALGLAAGSALGRIVRGVQPTDPVALGAALAGMAAVSLAAALVPARRAATVDLVAALRAD